MVEKKEDKPHLDEDVAEMADIYNQLADTLADCKISPTPDAVEAMAVSIVIGRGQKKNAEKYAQKQQSSTPAKSSAGASNAPLDNEKECPGCHTVLVRKFKQGGRLSGYFSCTQCKAFVNDDGTLVKWTR
jgi:hypothetical protein